MHALLHTALLLHFGFVVDSDVIACNPSALSWRQRLREDRKAHSSVDAHGVTYATCMRMPRAQLQLQAADPGRE